jgi:TetR/AcrR family transcriptional regulator, regulator of autoinduction and epiphytic fitness
MNITTQVDARHAAVLDAAVATFARYGFRKTSMEEVARAAGVSRQGLYLVFSNKEELFRRAVTHSLSSQLSAAVAVLAQRGTGLQERLVAACDEWAGRFVGMVGTDASDLMCASTSLAGETLIEYEARFEQALASAIGESAMAARCQSAGVCAAEAAHLLHATAQGLKRTSATRQEFVKGMTVAVRLFCAPHGRKD